MVLKRYTTYAVCPILLSVMTAMAFWRYEPAQAVRFLVAGIFLCVCGLEDVYERLIDDRLVALGTIGSLIYLYAVHGADAVWSAVKEAAVAAVLMLVLYVVARKGIGMGDIKVLCVLALLFGWVYTVALLSGALLMGLGVCVAQRIIHRKNAMAEIPFVPYILASAAMLTPFL